MNCKKCNTLLDPQTRFCPRCGAPVEENVEENTEVSKADYTAQATPTWSRPIEEEATLITPQQPMPLAINPRSLSQQQHTEQAQWSQSRSPLQPGGVLPYSQQQASSYPPNNQQPLFGETAPLLERDPKQIAMESQMLTAATTLQLQQGKRAARRSPGGCFLRLIATLILLFAVLVGAWFLALRPTLHTTAQNTLDKAMTRAVDRIPPVLAQIPLPPHTPLRPVKESELQTFLVLNIAPSDPVQDPVVHINKQGVRLEFTIHQNFLSSDFNFPSAVSFLPTLDANGHIVARNVHVEGIASLVMSDDEMSDLLNQHLRDAMQRLNHPISDLQLKQGEIDITLS